MMAFRAWARRHWPAAALVVSLLLNGFLLGILVMDSFRGRPGLPGPRAMNFELRHLAKLLPRDAVEEIGAELQPLAPQFEERVVRLRSLRDEINRMAAEPAPDRAAIDARLEALRAEAQALQAEVQKATFDALLRLPPETRAELAEAPKRG
ncbi:MAG TPA: periplasmic heavy metal sensor [Propylenella sp.]|nr:periplasmic heavy metal sensor [Propylenella sp.]